jgi:polar amino acid transport system substrate-binding protein
MDVHGAGRLMVMRRVLTSVAVGVVVATIAACTSGSMTGATGKFTPAHAHTLTVATAFLPAPGFWEGTAPNPTGGFERDLAHALAKRFGLASVSVTQVSFGDLVSGHLGGADLALSELTPTAQRNKVLDFSTPYLVSPPGVLTHPGTDPQDVASLRQLSWVAVEGSTLTRVISEVIRPERDPLIVPGRAEALQALDAGKAEAMLLDLPVALALEKQSPHQYSVPAQLSGPEGLAAALPSGSNNLEAVDTAIHAFLADGTIDKLSERWLGAKLANGADNVPLIRTEE